MQHVQSCFFEKKRCGTGRELCESEVSVRFDVGCELFALRAVEAGELYHDSVVGGKRGSWDTKHHFRIFIFYFFCENAANVRVCRNTAADDERSRLRLLKCARCLLPEHLSDGIFKSCKREIAAILMQHRARQRELGGFVAKFTDFFGEMGYFRSAGVGET